MSFLLTLRHRGLFYFRERDLNASRNILLKQEKKYRSSLYELDVGSLLLDFLGILQDFN